MTPLTVEQRDALRRCLYPVWHRHGAGYGGDVCAFCSEFLISQGGVRFKNAHAEGCGYIALCKHLEMAP